MADTPTLADMVTVPEKVIALAKAISGGEAGRESASRYLGDPPGNQ